MRRSREDRTVRTLRWHRIHARSMCTFHPRRMTGDEKRQVSTRANGRTSRRRTDLDFLSLEGAGSDDLANGGGGVQRPRLGRNRARCAEDGVAQHYGKRNARETLQTTRLKVKFSAPQFGYFSTPSSANHTSPNSTIHPAREFPLRLGLGLSDALGDIASDRE